MIACRVRGAASPLALMRRVFVVIALLCLLAPAGALASKQGGLRLIKDCASDGEITRHYTQSDYTYALDHLPSDLDEYTNCRDAIRAAQRAAAGGGGGGRSSHGGGGGGGGGSLGPGASAAPAVPTGPTAAERPAIANARKSPGPVNVGGGAPVTPGGPGITTTSFTRAVPGSMLLVLILLVLGALGAVGPAIRSRVLTRRKS